MMIFWHSFHLVTWRNFILWPLITPSVPTEKPFTEPFHLKHYGRWSSYSQRRGRKVCRFVEILPLSICKDCKRTEASNCFLYWFSILYHSTDSCSNLNSSTLIPKSSVFYLLDLAPKPKPRSISSPNPTVFHLPLKDSTHSFGLRNPKGRFWDCFSWKVLTKNTVLVFFAF